MCEGEGASERWAHNQVSGLLLCSPVLLAPLASLAHRRLASQPGWNTYSIHHLLDSTLSPGTH